MTELSTIRNEFQNDLKNLFDIAHAFIATTEIGASEVIKTLKENSNASYTFVIPFGTSDGVALTNINQLKHIEMYGIYFQNKGVIAELFYVRIVQRWYDFLNQIVEQIVKEHLEEIKSYPKISLKVNLNFNSANLLENIPAAVRDSFDFTKGIDKTKKIEDYLSIKLNDELKKQIKKNIIVRNLIEHNKGIIRQRDIDPIGKCNIKLIDNSCQEVEFQVGQKVEITIYELSRVKQHFYDAAQIFIPS